MPGEHHSIGRLTADLTPILIASRRTVVKTLIVCNTDTSNQTYNLLHVPADESSADDHALFFNTAIKSKTTQAVDTYIYLNVGDRIEALASVAGKIAMSLYSIDYDSYVQGARL